MNLGSASQADSNNQGQAWLEDNHEYEEVNLWAALK